MIKKLNFMVGLFKSAKMTRKNITEYPSFIQSLVKEIKKQYDIGEFYSNRFYEADEVKIAETILKSYNESKKCSCGKCSGSDVEEHYKE